MPALNQNSSCTTSFRIITSFARKIVASGSGVAWTCFQVLLRYSSCTIRLAASITTSGRIMTAIDSHDCVHRRSQNPGAR